MSNILTLLLFTVTFACNRAVIYHWFLGPHQQALAELFGLYCSAYLSVDFFTGHLFHAVTQFFNVDQVKLFPDQHTFNDFALKALC